VSSLLDLTNVAPVPAFPGLLTTAAPGVIPDDAPGVPDIDQEKNT
jgi:hypothetical protein